MRAILQSQFQNRWLYIFTTEGNVYAGQYVTTNEDVVQLRAPDGETLLHIALSDISGLRAFEQQPAVVPPPED